MSRGKKLDIFIGAEIEDGWVEVQTTRRSIVSDEILESSTKEDKPSKHFLVFKKEKRRGKTVTLVGEFHLPTNDSEETLKILKKKLGCGGTLKDGWMEFQGELKDKLRALLVESGFRFKSGH